jgi:hypothetical protein
MIRHARRELSFLSAALLLTLGGEVLAQMPRGGGAFGDWRVTVDYDGRTMESIVALTRGQGGALGGQWISFWGASDLSDIQFENGDLSFQWTTPGFDGGTMTSNFKGRIEEGALTGTLSSERGESAVKGARVPTAPRAAGLWDLAYRIGDRDVTGTLKITGTGGGGQGAPQTLAGEWISDMGEHKITAISAQRNALTFTRASKIQDLEFESTFTGTMGRDNTLTGTMTSEMGEAQVTGTRKGAAAIGTWNLDVTSERGPSKQRLRVNRDLSALYGANAIETVTVDGNKISFPITMSFGDQQFVMNFAGTIDGDALTGEVTSERGNRAVTGTRVVRAPGGGRPGGGM